MENEDKSENLLSLLDNPSDIPIEKLPSPNGVSSDVKNIMKESPINNKLYSYVDLSKKIQSMPVVPKVKTYFEKLDYFLDGGLQGGELMVMSGPSGNGKSLVCQTMAYNQGSNNVPSLWLTLEMGWQSTTRKFMAMDWEYQTMENPGSLPIFYPIDNRALSLDWLRKQIFKAKRENGVEIVYLDHLHSLLSLMDMKGNTSLILGGIVKELHQVVIEADVPLVLIAHTKKLSVGDVPDINSVRDCLPANQLVYVNGKRKRVDKLKIGDSVVSMRSIVKLQNDVITDIWKSGKKKIYKLTTRSGRTIEASEGHRFYAMTYKKSSEFEYGQNRGGTGIQGWTKLKDLKIKQKIAIAKEYSDTKIEEITPNQAIVLGWLIGDGHITKKYHSEITINIEEETTILKKIADDAFNLDCSVLPYKDKQAFRFYLTNKNKSVNNLNKWLKKYKYNPVGKNKYVPEFMFHQSKRIICKFLSGLFHADGSICLIGENGATLRLSSISSQLIDDVFELLPRVGIIGFKSKEKRRKGNFKNSTKFMYSIGIYGTNIIRFYERIGFYGHKNRKFKNIIKKIKPKDKVRNHDIAFERIKSIECIGAKETFDISVKGHHKSLKNNSFCVQGFLTHNSGMIVCEADFMGILWRERDKDSIKDDAVTENANVYTDRTFFSLEKNRRGREDDGESTGRMFLGKINGKLCPYSEYLYLRDNKIRGRREREEEINTDGIL